VWLDCELGGVGESQTIWCGWRVVGWRHWVFGNSPNWGDDHINILIACRYKRLRCIRVSL